MDTNEASCPDYYYTLNVPPSATTAEVERAYWRIVRSDKPEEEGGMDDVNEAYTVLTSPKLREQYDQVRSAVFGEGAPPQPPRPEKTKFKAPMAFMERQRPLPRAEAEPERHRWWALRPASWFGWLRSAGRRSPAS